MVPESVRCMRFAALLYLHSYFGLFIRKSDGQTTPVQVYDMCTVDLWDL